MPFLVLDGVSHTTGQALNIMIGAFIFSFPGQARLFVSSDSMTALLAATLWSSFVPASSRKRQP